jgi:diguanylate cyclase (GGDEF)-like protein
MHWLVATERRAPSTLVGLDAVQVMIVAGMIASSGGGASPLAFQLYPPVVLAGFAAGLQTASVIAGLASIGYLGASVLSGGGNLADGWSTLGSIWILTGIAGMIGSDVNRSRQRMAEDKERAERFSSVDWLTGLYNRRHLEYILPQEIARARRHGRPVSLLIVDADHLKEVNDQLGHLQGDQLLTHVAEVLTAQVRLVDTVIRFGGDEFVVIMPDTESESAMIPAERIRAAMSGYPVSAHGLTVNASISAGLATFPIDAEDGPTLLACADAALYVSKRNGRDRITIYQPEYAGATEPVGRG